MIGPGVMTNSRGVRIFVCCGKLGIYFFFFFFFFFFSFFFFVLDFFTLLFIERHVKILSKHQSMAALFYSVLICFDLLCSI